MIGPAITGVPLILGECTQIPAIESVCELLAGWEFSARHGILADIRRKLRSCSKGLSEPFDMETFEGEPARFLLFLDGEAVATIDFSRKTAEICDPSGLLQMTSAQQVMLDVLVPRILSHLGRLVIHAGAVEVMNKAVAIVGDSTHGKSTLVGSFHASGWHILGDDALIVEASPTNVRCQSVNRRLHVRDDTRRYLFSELEGGAALDLNSGDKTRIPLASCQRGSSPQYTIKCVVFLAPPDHDARGITLTRLSPSETCLRLIKNSFAFSPTDKEKAVGRMRHASTVADRIDAWELSYPRDFECLPDVRAAVLGLAG